MEEAIEALVPAAKPTIDAVMRVFEKGYRIAVSTSSGKDSSCLLALALEAAQRFDRMGGDPHVLVISSDTGVEQPEIARLIYADHKRVRSFARQRGLRVETHVARPALQSGFNVRVLSGRALPSYAKNNADCSVEWKAATMQRLRKKVLRAELRADQAEFVTLTGTRFNESVRREAKMVARGDSGEEPVRNKDGDLVLAAIAWMTADDVWEVLGWAASKRFDTYSDFADQIRLYASAGGSSCAVVSDAVLEGAKRPKAGCSARTGCHVCLQVSFDKSMVEMLKEERYSYMAGLSKVRNILAATQDDWSRRHWIGRTIDAQGFIKVGPDTLSPMFLRDLLRWYLTLDAQEAEAAGALGIRPRFQVVTLESAVALDVLWSLQGMHRPFEAIKQWVEIRDQGLRYAIPEIPIQPKRKMPPWRYLYVGDSWDGFNRSRWGGLSSPVASFAAELGGGDYCMGTRTLADGREVLDINAGAEMSIDIESVVLALEFDYDAMLAMNANANGRTGLTAGYTWWVSRGAVEIARSHVGRHDEVLRRTWFKERNGLAGPEVDLQTILARCVAAPELPAPMPWLPNGEVMPDVSASATMQAQLADALAAVA